MHWSQKAFHFLSVSNGATSILSDIVITLRSHIYFIRYCNNPTEITQNHFCGVFLKNHKYLREMFLRRHRDVTGKASFLSTEKTSFLRCFWDVLKTSQKSHLFWDVSERSLRCLSQWRSAWDLSETSHVGWVSTFSHIEKVATF